MDIRRNSFVIATHVYTTGPSQDLAEYLTNNRSFKLLFIGHPIFFDTKLKGSGYEQYAKGLLIRKKYSKINKISFRYSYIKDLILAIYWTIKYGNKSEIFIGCDCLNALAGIILKKMGVVTKVIYYVIDYNPYRFKNKIINYIFHKIDQFCVTMADETWNLSPRMEWARKRFFNFQGGNQIVIPVGVWYKRIKRKKFSSINRNTLVFMGHVVKKQGIQNVIKIIPNIIKKIPDFQLLVVGGGNYINSLRRYALNLKIGKHLRFTGYVKSHIEIENILTSCAVAIAPYEKYDIDGNLTYTYFADPSKIKVYLACGLPVIMSDVPYNAEIIQENQCGLIFKDNEKSIYTNILKLMLNPKKLYKYRTNAIKYSREFDWDNIFKFALQE